MTGAEQSPRPAVTTAPAEGASSGTATPRIPLGRRRLPAHIGPARTSTVLLAVAFLAIGLLYLFVKPPEPSGPASTTGTAGTVGDPAPTTSRGAAPTSTVPAAPPSPEESAAPEEDAAPEESAAPTSGVAPPPTGTPDDGTVEETTAPTTAEGTPAPTPETSAPPPTSAAPSS